MRCLYQPGQARAPRTSVVPHGRNAEAIRTRETLAQFLDAQLIRPLYASDAEAEARVTEALDTMTMAERITIEIEMQRRNAAIHTVDYDPLR